MAERRYGFRFSFAEGCIIVVSLVGSSFLVFLFGIYAGRELEARKAAEHTNSVRLTVTGGGEAANSAKEEQETPAAVLQPPTAATADKPKTVVVVTSPRLPEHVAAAATPVNSPSIGSQETTSAAKLTAPQKLQSAAGEYQSTKASPSTPPPTVSSVAVPDKKLTPFPAKEPVAGMESLKRVQTNAATLKAGPAPSVASPGAVAEEKKQTEEEDSHPSLAKKPLPAQGRWSVQVQALRDKEGARQLVRKLQSQGYAPMVNRVVRDGEVWYRVRVGSFASSEEARISVERLRREGKFPQAYPASN
ncbi:MAG: SPOR domain-containing protein [Deltaproteobacteria bacterium]|nr:SPOR domain-containing protein [Deltaproteobacteria bacterium]